MKELLKDYEEKLLDVIEIIETSHNTGSINDVRKHARLTANAGNYRNFITKLKILIEKQETVSVDINEEAYQKLIDEDILQLEVHMPEYSLEKTHIIEVLNWSVKKMYDDNSDNRGQGLRDDLIYDENGEFKDDVLKKCMITRYDKTITKPPYLTIQIDKVDVFQPEEDEYGIIFASRLRSACESKGYYFKFYTMCSDNDEFDYEIVVN